MNKKKKGRSLNRKKDDRKALLRSMASSLILEEKIKTTEAKAKEVSSFVEKQITKSRIGTLHSRRMLAANFSPRVVKKLADELALRYKERKGGYTRITKLIPRKIDGAKMAIIELIK
jgi:large subunit ribosomal protein L17